VPQSDEERLERVYRRAESLKTMRRFRAAALLVPVLVLAAAVALAASPGDRGSELVQADTTTTTETTEVTETTETTAVAETTTTTGPPPAPVTTTVVKPPLPTTTTTTGPPPAENCGGDFSGNNTQPKPPQGMVVTAEASKRTVKRGEDVLLTLRAHWTGSEPFTNERGQSSHLLYAHLNGEIFYQNQYDPSAPDPSAHGDETFMPNEVKTYTVRWKTSQSCGATPGMHEATLRTGTYTVDGIWGSKDGTWAADASTFEIVD